jgi:hypothetical protein
MSTSKLFSLHGILAASLLVGCADAARDDRSMCLTPEQLAAYDLAYESAESADTAALREIESSEVASCALAGTRAALRKKRRGGRGGHHGRGRDGRDRDGRGHRDGGHHGSRDDDQGCGSREDRACRDDGRFAGELAAAAYCELSITLGGLDVEDMLAPGPESRCSRKYEEACQRLFDEVARQGDCRPFTTGEFQEAYEVARFNACLFSLDELNPQP